MISPRQLGVTCNPTPHAGDTPRIMEVDPIVNDSIGGEQVPPSIVGLPKSVDPLADERVPSYRVELTFRPHARAFAVMFFATLAVSGVVTFKFTEYAKATDKIILFYKTFNPCIFFDHYPAKIIATIGIAVMLVSATLFATVLLLHTYTNKRLFQVVFVSILYAVVFIIDANFINVFTTNLYPETNPDRRLHGMEIYNNTLTLSTELSTADKNTVVIHTAFYIAWVLGNVILSIYVVIVVLDMGWRRSNSIYERSCWTTAMIIGWFGMVFHMGAMIVKVIHGDGQLTMDEIDSGLQKVIVKISESAKTGMWGWIAIFYFRFLVPPQAGVALTFRLSTIAGDDGSIDPAYVLRVCFAFVGSIIMFGAIFHVDLENDDSTLWPLVGGMRSKPYAFFAAPAMYLVALALGFGLSLTLVQDRLEKGQWSRPLVACAATMFASLFSCLLIIVEQERFTRVFAVMFLLSNAAWVMLRNCLSQVWRNALWSDWRIKLVPFVYVVLLFAWMVAGVFHWALAIPVLILISLYTGVVPKSPALYVTVVKLELTVAKLEQ
jgi:hypothetical protein